MRMNGFVVFRLLNNYLTAVVSLTLTVVSELSWLLFFKAHFKIKQYQGKYQYNQVGRNNRTAVNGKCIDEPDDGAG